MITIFGVDAAIVEWKTQVSEREGWRVDVSHAHKQFGGIKWSNCTPLQALFQVVPVTDPKIHCFI